MNDKYIIKSCPMYFHGNCYGHTGNCNCSDCTDCLLKQIVNKCNYYQKKIGRTLEYRSGYVDATRDILQLFDIQEVVNE